LVYQDDGLCKKMCPGDGNFAAALTRLLLRDINAIWTLDAALSERLAPVVVAAGLRAGVAEVQV
jgi:hypothetical protein